MKLLHIKSFSWMSNVAFNATMNLLQKEFPEACLPDSFDAAMKYIRSMGLGYKKIHVCKNNCILFRKEKCVKLDVCPYAVKQIQDGRMQTPTSMFLKRY
jgi:hypothetical protein